MLNRFRVAALPWGAGVGGFIMGVVGWFRGERAKKGAPPLELHVTMIDGAIVHRETLQALVEGVRDADEGDKRGGRDTRDRDRGALARNTEVGR